MNYYSPTEDDTNDLTNENVVSQETHINCLVKDRSICDKSIYHIDECLIMDLNYRCP